ncbi:MAG: hypothetical protein TR69_WS6001001465 [candidate division WS6 bacterium OLB20]|uniref:Uncharacterized protein n=1 Tax=candidate division WS6 bacterium OLB20 TaxID=1617426 RepID=A0A136LW47_9BACT|nr:MAG: hypothetical protein TR69_WS6001001465 [candidate division WS6 bacterium OLB20]
MFRIVLNIMLFITFMVIMPGISSPKGPVAAIIAGFGFALIMTLLANILNFFKFPDNFWGNFLIGTLLTLLYFVLLQFLIRGIIEFGAGYIGGSDFIIFTLPKLVTLADPLFVLVFSAVALVLCSIILDKLSDS